MKRLAYFKNWAVFGAAVLLSLSAFAVDVVPATASAPASAANTAVSNNAAAAANASTAAATAKAVNASNASRNAANNAAAPALPSTGSSWTTMMFGLMLVLGLIVCVSWMLKRTGLAPTMHASAAAKVVGAVSVGNRERIVVVEVADQWIVVGVSPGRVNALTTMPKQESAPGGAVPVTKNFSSWMKQTIEKRNVPRP
jgi:flagellar protein FliO/FliZ